MGSPKAAAIIREGVIAVGRVRALRQITRQIELKDSIPTSHYSVSEQRPKLTVAKHLRRAFPLAKFDLGPSTTTTLLHLIREYLAPSNRVTEGLIPALMYQLLDKLGCNTRAKHFAWG